MQEISKKLSEQSVEKVLDRPEYRKELSVYWEGLKKEKGKCMLSDIDECRYP